MNKIIFLVAILCSISCQSAVLNVKDFGANGSDLKDDTAAFQKCVDKLVTLGGGTVEIPKGNYFISRLTFFGKKYSNITINGNGSTINQVFIGKRKMIERWNTFANVNAADGCFIFDAKVSKQFDDSNSLKNIKISNLNFVSDVKKLGFDELIHQISAHGVSGFTVDNCTFTGFLGDGIAINAGTDFTKNYGAYNKDVTITNCKFDGLNRNNRQGISFYYCDGFLVENCSFKNTTREDMPGAIDIEPMSDWQISRNGVIRNCSFTNIGGIGAIVIIQQKKTPSNPTASTNYIIENCTFDNVRVPLGVFGHDEFEKVPISNNYDIIFRNSTVMNYKSLFVSRKGYNVLVDNVKFDNVQLPGYPVCLNEGKNIKFKNCAFNNYITDKDYCFIESSKNVIFQDCIYKKKT